MPPAQLPASIQPRVVVVLVRARNPANIGAVARAMQDFGFPDLRVVNEYPVPFEGAKSAVDAAPVLHAARQFTTLAPALADCTLVLGTTAVGDRVLEHPLHTLAEAAGHIHSTLATEPAARVALLFGSEKTGLSNDELSLCHGLLTIPMSPGAGGRHLSMNLGQAAAVCLYALAQGSGPQASATAAAEQEPAAAAVTGADLQRLDTLLAEVFEASGYSRRNPANARPANLRRLARRMALTATDAPVWTGVLRQILHAITARRDESRPQDDESQG